MSLLAHLATHCQAVCATSALQVLEPTWQPERLSPTQRNQGELEHSCSLFGSYLRTAHLEKLVASLVGLLASQRTQLPQNVQSLLHDADMQRPSLDADMEEDGPASLGELEESESEPPHASEPSEEPAKRRRQDPGPALAWAHVPALPFSTLCGGV